MMSNYRRPKIPGATVFFTVALACRGTDTLLREVDTLRDAVRQTRKERPFHINAWVILPDHMHCVWTLPPGDSDFSTRMAAIKARFTRRVGFHPTIVPIPPEPPEQEPFKPAWKSFETRVGYNPTLRSPSKIKKGEAGVWQRRFWEHHIRDAEDLRNHINYCWHNPIKHGLVEHPKDWPHSSWHRDNP